jgi:hypothetical protein
MITSSNKLRFDYTVQRPEGAVIGYGWAEIVSKDGRPELVKGNFYQVPPVDPLFGWMEFKKK